MRTLWVVLTTIKWAIAIAVKYRPLLLAFIWFAKGLHDALRDESQGGRQITDAEWRQVSEQAWKTYQEGAKVAGWRS